MTNRQALNGLTSAVAACFRIPPTPNGKSAPQMLRQRVGPVALTWCTARRGWISGRTAWASARRIWTVHPSHEQLQRGSRARVRHWFLSGRSARNGLIAPDTIVQFKFAHQQRDLGKEIRFEVARERLEELQAKLSEQFAALKECRVPRAGVRADGPVPS